MTDKATIGPIISDTMRPQDLIPAFVGELRRLGDARDRNLWRRDYWNDPAELLDELQGALNELAPPYAYFGTNPDDGACFGFWPDLDAVDMAAHDGDLLRVDDLADVPDDYTGDVAVINDHGNLTVGRASNGEFSECWAIV